MIKKHIITCTIVLALLVMAKVFAYQRSNKKVSDIRKENITTNTLTETTSKTKEIEEPKLGEAPLNFAKEALPTGNTKVNNKMKVILAAHTYGNLQTHRLHRKAAEWFPIIEPILAIYGIPNDFKYIPLVESGLQAGTSSKGARGIWQFMPATARGYGLKVNGDVDERLNVRKSTIAACKYIKEMYGSLKNWTLVAAAYNVGDGRLKRQMIKQGKHSYYSMKLNRETGGYVYKLISMKQIVENPARYGYKKKEGLLAYKAE